MINRMVFSKVGRRLVLVVMALSVTFVVGCGSLPTTPVLSSVESDIEFIDLDLFDLSLTQNLRQKTELVSVTFPNQETAVNELPDRLQRWLSAVHVNGGGVSVETIEGYRQKDISMVLALLVSGYKLAVKAVPVVLSKKYRAVIVTDAGKVDRIEFERL